MAGLRWEKANRRARAYERGAESKHHDRISGQRFMPEKEYLAAVYAAALRDEAPPPVPDALSVETKLAIERHPRGTAGWAWSHPAMSSVVSGALVSKLSEVQSGAPQKRQCCVCSPDGVRCNGKATRSSPYCRRHSRP